MPEPSISISGSDTTSLTITEPIEQVSILEADGTSVVIDTGISENLSVIEEAINLTIIEEVPSVTISNDEVLQIVELSSQGPSGPSGPPGSTGPQGPAGSGGDLTYVHRQEVAASVWTITHTLGKVPSVTVVDSGDSEVVGEVNFPSLSQVVITFNSAFTGKAYLN